MQPVSPSVSPKAAFYAGSFDPLTNGHLSVIFKAIQSFDRMVIGIGYNPNKKEFLPLETRISMIREAIQQSDQLKDHADKITVISFSDTYTVSAAVANGCGALVRGLRNTNDFEEENLLATVNETLCEDLGLPRLQTHLFNADADKVGISSSMVKNMIGFTGWEKAVKRYVPAIVLEKLVEKYATR